MAVAGAGPAGLALAIAAANRGLSVTVLERQEVPVDKACGEGLMPAGLAVLERLGVRAHLAPEDCAPFHAIRYVQEDGSAAEGRLPAPGGLGIRRLALSRALLARADALGVEVRTRCPVRAHERSHDAVVLSTPGDPVRARILVAADGLASTLRRAEGLELSARGPRRYGLRQHFRVAPWAPRVEVHLSPGVEAYVTPAGRQRVGVAFLWERGFPPNPSVASLRARFPHLAARLGDAEPDSEPRGAGPLAQRARSVVADRFVLLGDAAGYVDAVTGEGLSLALVCAEALAAVLPQALVRGATARELASYVRVFRREFRRYEVLTRGVLALARRPRLRRPLVRVLGRAPRLFDAVLAVALGTG
ncbi:MAG: NAD(P)/FAD-dependent oxidoreductase [Myxococcaceae bacterium]|nr:NAD(P)/FAD-dependent oxidoreductase [Myxococcaceae bacterium]